LRFDFVQTPHTPQDQLSLNRRFDFGGKWQEIISGKYFVVIDLRQILLFGRKTGHAEVVKVAIPILRVIRREYI
jgi:hypothetical protein